MPVPWPWLGKRSWWLYVYSIQETRVHCFNLRNQFRFNTLFWLKQGQREKGWGCILSLAWVRFNTLEENHASKYIVTKTKQSYACIKVKEKGVKLYFEFSMSHQYFKYYSSHGLKFANLINILNLIYTKIPKLFWRLIAHKFKIHKFICLELVNLVQSGKW